MLQLRIKIQPTINSRDKTDRSFRGYWIARNYFSTFRPNSIKRENHYKNVFFSICEFSLLEKNGNNNEEMNENMEFKDNRNQNSKGGTKIGTRMIVFNASRYV